MKTFESLNNFDNFPNPVLTIGNYDGIHLGHRKIIEMVKARAAEISGTSMLMTFDPHPLSVLRPDNHLGLITPVNIRKRLIEENGIDVLLLLPFTDEFRLTDPEVFVRDILVGKLGIKGLVVGYDFKFGKGGKGNTDILKTLSGKYGFFFDIVEAITLNDEKIGSNRIRKLIMTGDVKKAEVFLGRPYIIEGRVLRGYGRGGGIGFPTINIETEFEVIPKNGVYISEVRVDDKTYRSVTNIGYNPTFNNRDISIETFILDYSDSLYGKEVSLYFHERIRDEIKFNNVDELKHRINIDVQVARSYFERAGQ
ncbi:MAG: bifunctional riboflavin kinase/FAD synthetase [Proteobacteria bacterium]|nr:bifunctional riboflavin kinase/FAD synthetase [Pseudomonadota bacterium]